MSRLTTQHDRSGGMTDDEHKKHMAERAREQTAATILAALLGGVGPDLGAEREAEYAAHAVRLADALRVELAKAKP